MVRIVLASLPGGTVVFLWASISWAILPWHLSSMAVLPDGEETFAWSLAGLVIAAFIKRSASELSERGMVNT